MKPVQSLPASAEPRTSTNSPGLKEVPAAPIILGPLAGEQFQRGGFGVHWKIDGAHTAGRFSIVHHPLAPRTLAAPLHRHNREDEYSYVVTGTLGALLGDDVVTAGPGAWVFKPRYQWHTFWNAGDTPCEIIEVISPARFEDYFRALAAAWPDMEKFAAIAERFELEVDRGSVPGLCARFGVKL
jgi:mannose-6-phosphate isomerase-like protein (cupin superfamily)